MRRENYSPAQPLSLLFTAAGVCKGLGCSFLVLLIYLCDFTGANEYASEMPRALLMLGAGVDAGDGRWRNIAKGDVSDTNRAIILPRCEVVAWAAPSWEAKLWLGVKQESEALMLSKQGCAKPKKVNSPGSVSCAHEENVQSHLCSILQWRSCNRNGFCVSLDSSWGLDKKNQRLDLLYT